MIPLEMNPTMARLSDQDTLLPRKTWVSALHLQMDDIEWYWMIFPMILNTHTNIDDIWWYNIEY